MIRFSILALALLTALLVTVSCEATTTAGSSIGNAARGVVDSVTGGSKLERAAHSAESEGSSYLASVGAKVGEAKDGCVGAAEDMARSARDTVQGAGESVADDIDSTRRAAAEKFEKASDAITDEM